jgi:hypothetical protein
MTGPPSWSDWRHSLEIYPLSSPAGMVVEESASRTIPNTDSEALLDAIGYSTPPPIASRDETGAAAPAAAQRRGRG